MFKVALGIEYDGSLYHGWQLQPNVVSVQQLVEEALFKIANHRISIICAGRTDKGVHATNQVVHFSTTCNRCLDAWVRGTNVYLPKSIRIKWARLVDEDFHARFSAVARSYCYVIYNNAIDSAVLQQKVCWIYYPLNIELMQSAANLWIGEHDFASLQAQGCQSKTTIRRVSHISLRKQGDFIIIQVSANGFLYHMVRNMVGVLLAIGREAKPVNWAHDLLTMKNRRYAGVTATAMGLYLSGVKYPQHFGLPNFAPLSCLLI